MAQTINPVYLIAIVAGAFALIWLLTAMGQTLVKRQTWGQCFKCRCWFNELDEVSTRPPRSQYILTQRQLCKECLEKSRPSEKQPRTFQFLRLS